MATITKKEFASRIAEKTGLSPSDVTKVVQTFMSIIVDELAAGNRFEFREFGVFETRQRKARTARNPKTGEKIRVAARRVVAFKPGLAMKRKVQDAISWLQD